MARDRELPGHARCVIIGGGVGGTSIAYHLAELGWRDVVLVDRAELTSGSTFHSAGLVGQLRSSVSLTRMMMYSVELYRKLDSGWIECGGLRLASSPERWEETRRQAGWAKTFGLPLELISAEEAREKFPLMVGDGVLGASWLPTDGYLDPSRLTYALAEGARRGGCRIFTGTRVTGIDVYRGRVHRVRTDRGDIVADAVVNAGGMYAAEIGRLAGVRIPVVPFAHEYLVTQPLSRPGASSPPRSRERLPTLRDPDLQIYFREEGEGLVMGGYERDSAPWSLRDGLDHDPARLQRAAARGGLGALRGDRGQRAQARPRDRARPDHPPDQRARGVHARRRVLPRGDERARLLRGRRLLRARARGRGRRRPGDGGVDPRGGAVDRPVADGHPALRPALPLAPVCAGPGAGGL